MNHRLKTARATGTRRLVNYSRDGSDGWLIN
jgi:hypothetical protein